MQQRYYDPAIGRFLSVDPVRTNENSGDNFGRYTYADDDPLGSSDPDGRLTVDRPWWKDVPATMDCTCESVNQTGQARVVVYMNLNSTVFTSSDGMPTVYESRNDVSRRSLPGADEAYKSADSYPTKGPHHGNSVAYGPNDILKTDDPRGRWSHGGGTGLKDPEARRQGWKPTLGCTRMQNEDVQALVDQVRSEKAENPKAKVPYERKNFVAPTPIISWEPSL
jgi:uncharacterized protein RhaS with RHS repeats